MKSLFYLFLISIVFFTSCLKDRHYEFVEMKFELPATMTSERDTINLGDTLLFKMDFSDSLKDFLTGKSYKIKNFPFNLFLSSSKIGDTSKSITQQPDYTDKFLYVNISGDFVNTGDISTNFRPVYNQDSYSALCKIIPRERGIFSFRINYYIPTDDNIPDSTLTLPNALNGKKQIPFLRFPKFIFNNGNTNFSLLKKNAKVAGDSTEWIGCYTFVVR